MDDIKERLRVLDRLEPPDLRARLGTHSLEPPPRRPSARVAVAFLAVVVAAVGIGIAYLALQGTTRPAVPSVVPALHPNGPIWFLGDHGAGPGSIFGPSGLYSVAPDGTGLVKVSLPDRLYSITGLAVSPDGRLVAMSNGGGEFPPRNLYVMRPDGSGLRQITRGSYYDVTPAWSPDGAEIVFSSDRCCATDRGLSGYALYTVGQDGSGLRQLTSDSASDLAPAWSPDGSRVAYVQMPGNSARGAIWVISADGSDPRKLTDDSRHVDAVTWSPDARELAYISHLGDGVDWEIRVLRPDGSDLHTVYTCTTPCANGGYTLAWSPDGSEIAFWFGGPAGYESHPTIGVVGVDGSGFHVVDTHGVGACCLSWIPARR